MGLLRHKKKILNNFRLILFTSFMKKNGNKAMAEIQTIQFGFMMRCAMSCLLCVSEEKFYNIAFIWQSHCVP